MGVAFGGVALFFPVSYNSNYNPTARQTRQQKPYDQRAVDERSNNYELAQVGNQQPRYDAPQVDMAAFYDEVCLTAYFLRLGCLTFAATSPLCSHCTPSLCRRITTTTHNSDVCSIFLDWRHPRRNQEFSTQHRPNLKIAHATVEQC